MRMKRFLDTHPVELGEGVWTAEIASLGLGAYGATEEEAIDRLHEMFIEALLAHTHSGKLSEWLYERAHAQPQHEAPEGK